jgi:hypothetical protein
MIYIPSDCVTQLSESDQAYFAELFQGKIESVHYNKVPEYGKKIQQGDVLIISDYSRFGVPRFVLKKPIDPTTGLNFDDMTMLAMIEHAVRVKAKIIGIHHGGLILPHIAGADILNKEKPFIDSSNKTDINYNFSVMHDRMVHKLYGQYIDPKKAIAIESAHSFLVYPFHLDRLNYSIISYAGALSVTDEERYSTCYGCPSNYVNTNKYDDLTFECAVVHDYFSVDDDHIEQCEKSISENFVVDPEIILFRNHDFLYITDLDPKNDDYNFYLRHIIDRFKTNKL